ncbi:hypothetical protein EVAR_14328_1 [Eumeta japonica]|uniref:Uncharacterized protein n=1 Tax=Eumeta variegata TaxID=151549 RepID=A0A4C1UN49_EUMVA|nr:hypothetical protein EVAR_14328_1 [Eumeta japonica]
MKIPLRVWRHWFTASRDATSTNSVCYFRGIQNLSRTSPDRSNLGGPCALSTDILRGFVHSKCYRLNRKNRVLAPGGSEGQIECRSRIKTNSVTGVGIRESATNWHRERDRDRDRNRTRDGDMRQDVFILCPRGRS